MTGQGIYTVAYDHLDVKVTAVYAFTDHGWRPYTVTLQTDPSVGLTSTQIRESVKLEAMMVLLRGILQGNRT